MSGNFIYRHHVEPRVKLHSPREESFPSPLKYIDVSRTTHKNLDVMQESRINDYWNVDGSRDLSVSWTGFTVYSIKWETSRRICVVRGWDWQNCKRHPGQIICGQNSVEDWQEMQSWGRSINGQLKNQSSIMQEDDEEFISLTLRTRNSKKKTVRMQEENWKHQ